MNAPTLNLGAGLRLPVDTATQALAFLGRRGSGKTYSAMKLAEEMLDAAVQIVVLDPVGTWWGLRLKADGKGAGFPIPVFGGLHGDVPLEPSGGQLVADLIADRGIPAVLDVSQMLAGEQARFAYDFATRFFQRKKAAPSVVHLFIEECQEFVPQNVARGGGFEARMLHAFERLIKLGRNFGIGVSLISQRPQEVNKKALNQSEVLFAFQMTGPQERKAIQGWVSDKGLTEDLGDLLPHLKVGEPHVWSPQWLQVSKTVKIGRKRTFDASSTPKVGAGKADVRPLAPVDIEQIRDAMAATIQRAEADDPKLLRRRIAELERAVQAAEAAQPPAPPPERIEVPIVSADQIVALQSSLQAAQHIRDQLAEATEALAAVIRSAHALNASAPAAPVMGDFYHLRNRTVAPPTPRAFGAGAVVPKARTPIDGDGRSLRKGARRMLEALARRHPVGTTWPQVAQLAGLARTGGTFTTYQGDLRRGGYVAEDGDLVLLTDAGWDAIGQQPGTLSPQSTSEVLDLYRGVLRAGARRMLDQLMAVYPRGLSRAELGTASGIAENGGTFSTYLGDLRRAGLIDDEDGVLTASTLLMDPANAR